MLSYVKLYKFYIFFSQLLLNNVFYITIKRYNIFMDKRELTVIESKNLSDVRSKKEQKVNLQTNPIVKKLAKFHFEKPETFSVKDLFKK